MKKIFLIILVAVIATSCENDIDLKADDTSGVLCINGNLTAGARDNVINVAVTGKERAVDVKDAKVIVTVNGIEVETIDGSPVAHGTYVYDDEDYDKLGNLLRWYRDGDYPISAKFAPGDRVQIDVIYGDQHASAVGTVPQPVVGGSVKVALKENVAYKRDLWSESYDNSDMAAVEVTITDPDPSSKNFFRMAVTQSDTVKMRLDENEHYLSVYYWRLEGGSHTYYENGKEIYTEYETMGYYDNYDEYGYYFENDPILSAEVVKSEGDISFVDAVDNVYKIFTDNFFNGSTATLNVMRPLRYDWRASYMPATFDYTKVRWGNYVLLHDIDYYAPRYTHRNYVDVYSITEDEYYYLKVLNARGPESYFDFEDDYSLTGDVKLPSNVTGGSGNIFLNARTSLSGYMHEDYVPEYVGEPYPSDGWDDVPYEYGDEE